VLRLSRILLHFAMLAALMPVAAAATSQAHKPVRKPAGRLIEPVRMAPDMICPTPLGIGATTKRAFCDVMTGRDPAAGILIKFPPHTGSVTLSFDLHNRHTYSEEQVRTHRAYARYTSTVGVLTMDNTLIGRAVVQNEFRTAGDLVDRIGGGAGPGGLKAVAPTGTESITMMIPEAESQVSILGEKLTYERVDGSATYSSPGRPIAIVSNVMIEYRPAPPPRPVRTRR
jgi:hypothetical protein